MKALRLFAFSACTSLLFLGTTGVVYAAGDSGESSESVMHFGIIFAMFALLLVAGKIGNFLERFGQPPVVGELAMGIVLAGLGFLGWGFIGEAASNEIIAFIASFGALLLIFSVGLESSLTQMRHVGFRAVLVACLGAAASFIFGAYIAAPLLFPEASSVSRLFLGAAIVATSMGITASILRSLNVTRTRAAQTFLGATVVNDVIGLILLAIVASIAISGTVSAGSIAMIALQSFGFLVGAIILGRVCAKPLSKVLGKIHSGIGMKLTFAVSFMLLFGFLAEVFGLEPIIGAFAAGLILEQVHFRAFADPEIVSDLKSLPFKRTEDREMVANLINKHRKMHIEDLVQKMSLVFIPIFFVYTGMQINFASLLQPNLYVIALGVSFFAVLGSMLAGLAAKGSFKEKMLVGATVMPRGEVGLIFAATGKSLGILSDQMFSVIVLVVVMTTFAAPTIIKRLVTLLYPEKVATPESAKKQPQHRGAQHPRPSAV
jgi:Kef-type K+ transport system membrane component KefB